MDIDYANVFALTVYGKIGIKVWICKGEVLAKRDLNPNFVGGKSDVSDRRERRDDRGGDFGRMMIVETAGVAANFQPWWRRRWQTGWTRWRKEIMTMDHRPW
jgi:hypothetical protein